MYYFASDVHLGAGDENASRRTERRFVKWLDSVAEDATAIFLVGDIFDFWWEYGKVIPKGFVRTLGKLAELSDKGVKIYFFIGNHDIWCKRYLTEECGVIMHYEPVTVDIDGKLFYLAHGDGLGDPDRKFRFLRSMFHNPVLQWLFAGVSSRWGLEFGLEWAKHSRQQHEKEGAPRYEGEDKEPLIIYSKEYLKSHPDINYFVFGHRHIELDLMLSRTARVAILGDWISLFSYAVFDGEHFFMEQYIEGETEP